MISPYNFTCPHRKGAAGSDYVKLLVRLKPSLRFAKARWGTLVTARHCLLRARKAPDHTNVS